MEFSKDLPVLSAVEIRVLGALMEKSKTTPDYYPMSLNAITAACNQKTSRYPAVDYDEATVSAALSSLKAQSLVSTAVGGGSRTIKFKHNFGTVFPLTDGELALLCLLFLRGAQTPGELNTNAGRLFEFQSLSSIQETLQLLATHQPPFVKELEKRPGQKEARFMHLLGQTSDLSEEIETDHKIPTTIEQLESRIASLEQEVSEIKQMALKWKDLMGE